MRNKFAYVKILISALLLSNHSGAWAALQTTPYLALQVQPKFANANAMPYANVNAPKGGRLIESKNGTFDNLNGMNGQGRSVEGSNYLFDTLFSKSLDEPNVFYPLLAEKVEYDPEKTQYATFYLNPKARFSNGQPLLAEDVKFTFDTYLTKSNLGLQMYLADLDQTIVLSKHAIKMTFKSGNNKEMPMILSQMPIFSKKDWENKDFTRVTLKPILGSGPYTVKNIDAGRSITYQRNPDYWGKDLPVNRGRYNFDQIKYVYYRNMDIEFEGFKSGQYTFHKELRARRWMTEYNFPAYKAGMVKKYTAKLENPATTQSYVFNIRKKPLDDIYLRQAMTYAYDFEWQNKALFYGQYQRLQSHFQLSELEAKSKPSQAELKILSPYLSKLHPLQREGVLKEWKYPVTDASGFNRSGLLKAREILLKAGYQFKQGRLIDRRGKPVEFELMIHQEGLQRTLMVYIRNLKKLGIQVNIRKVDVPQYLERMRRYDFEITTMVMPQSLNPGNEQAQLWSSKAANEKGNYNFSGIQNSVIDHVIRGVIEAPNRKELILHTQVLDRLLRAGYYQILTYANDKELYAYWNMYQQPKIKPKLAIGEDYWWIDAKQEKKIAQYLRKQ